MKILVTGGSGFVGEHLVRRLAGDGHAVLALARSATSADKARDLGAAPLRAELCYVGRTSRAERLKQMTSAP
nr:NAD-dependent epimerase/dehydratase family protein [Mycobacterium sp. DL99]